ncbi:hypothetical protein Pyn_37754 [Prunus yedoensis var. nudiflora]|uniref:Uncharacterized protein n=1 Tax=Prunus yedoensis var. nudiflora TaxID=2094558 RepID=A0A314ZA94_PRUYE|nr:hypothetical protein Pyn_37754 [Prunus yedoensis var. nudiflora]
MHFSRTTKAWVESILSNQPCKPLKTKTSVNGTTTQQKHSKLTTNRFPSSSTFSSSRKVVSGPLKNPIPPLSDFNSDIETWFVGQESKRVKRETILTKMADIDVHGLSGYGGQLGLKKKLEGGLKKKVDGGLASEKNEVDYGLGVKRKFESALGLNKEVEGGDHGLLRTPSISCEVSSSQSQSCCETPVTVLRPHLCHASPVKATSASNHEINNDLSPRRAARVAMLKARFANTILKAEHHHALYTTTITTEAKNERLGAAEAEIMRANEFIKKQRQKDREAARLALEKMEKHVVIEDNFKTMRDFHLLISGPK